MPVTTLVVPGNCADDPLYVPQIQKVQQAFGRGGKTYVGDCKMAALGTRAYLASTRDYYLCPLSEKQLSQEDAGWPCCSRSGKASKRCNRSIAPTAMPRGANGVGRRGLLRGRGLAGRGR